VSVGDRCQQKATLRCSAVDGTSFQASEARCGGDQSGRGQSARRHARQVRPLLLALSSASVPRCWTGHHT
jgi:hypothetical protein